MFDLWDDLNIMRRATENKIGKKGAKKERKMNQNDETDNNVIFFMEVSNIMKSNCHQNKIKSKVYSKKG